MKTWILPLLLAVELAIFVPHSGVRFDSWGSFSSSLRYYMSDVAVLAAPLLILSLGMTIVLMTAGIDLSVGAMVAVVAGVVSSFAPADFWLKALPAGLLAAVALGAFNGVLIARLDVPPIIATLGTMILYRGTCSIVLADRENESIVPGWMGEFPGAAILALALVTLAGAYFARSRLRREILLLGGNRVAARYAGIPVDRRIVQVYAFMGLLAFVAALCALAHDGSVNAGWQEGLELKIIVAVVLGGTRVVGGRGSIVGSLPGVLIVTVLEVGLIGIHRSDWILVLLGPLLVLGVWLNTHVDPALRAVRA
jgi:ribose/xylose/arabinose/galactoside ABC-type transport system permease subunit